MNTKLLKSIKLIRLLRECGLVSGQSELPMQLIGKARQISIIEIDLAFKKICSQHERSPERPRLEVMMNTKLTLGNTSFQ